MKSLSEDKRPWSVVPMRAFGDRTLKERELRVLGALSAFANRAGVCWPSMFTLCDVTAYKERQTIHDAIKVLKQKRYIRQLRPKDYQETASGWKSNRYQVLWDGDEPLPTREEIDTAKPLQLVRDQDGDGQEETGGLGDREVNTHNPDQPRPGDPKLTGIQLTADEICNAYIVAVQQATGQARLYANEIAHARRLADAGHGAADVKAATLNVCDQALERRAGVPSLADVARAMSV